LNTYLRQNLEFAISRFEASDLSCIAELESLVRKREREKEKEKERKRKRKREKERERKKQRFLIDISKSKIVHLLINQLNYGMDKQENLLLH